MNCTATTRLTAAECLARLADCPALPRGERLQWATPSSSLWNRAMRHRANGRGSLLRPVLWTFPITAGSTVSREALDVCWARWRTIAAPVRRLREERRALREALADVIGPPCEKRTRWCFTHQTNDCRADEARKLLAPEEDLDRSCDNCGAAPGTSCNCHLGRFIP